MVARDVKHKVSDDGTGVPLWQDDRRAGGRRAALSGDVTADIAIVGAGFTGLWTAYYLLKTDPSLKVVLVEREYAGFGASGRNGGWASSIFPVSLARVAKLYDHSAALRLQAAMNQTVTEIGDVVAAEGIDCEYARQGFLSLARNEAQLARAKATVVGQSSSVPPGNGASWPRPRHATWSTPPVCSAGSSPSTAHCCSRTNWFAAWPTGSKPTAP